MEQLKKQINERYFGKELPFTYRVFMVFFVECFVVSLLFAVLNTAKQKDPIGIVLQWVFLALRVVVFCLPTNVRMRAASGILVFVGAIYLPTLFIFTGGYHGITALFGVLTVFLAGMLLRGKPRVGAVLLYLTTWLLVSLLQYFIPNLVTPHANETEKMVDFVVGLVLCLGAVASFSFYFKEVFLEEQSRTKILLEKEAEHNRQLEKLSNEDPLTGAHNRRYLTNYLLAELKNQQKMGVTILNFDIDHFKRINDTFGHAVGDEVLVALVARVKHALREEDTLARVGGEEFIVVIKNITEKEAIDAAERIRMQVAEMTFSQDFRITVSVGVAKAQQGESYDSLVGRSDAALYQAKNRGRNCVVASTEPPRGGDV